MWRWKTIEPSCLSWLKQCWQMHCLWEPLFLVSTKTQFFFLLVVTVTQEWSGKLGTCSILTSPYWIYFCLLCLTDFNIQVLTGEASSFSVSEQSKKVKKKSLQCFKFLVRLYSDNARMTLKRGDNNESRYELRASCVIDVVTMLWRSPCVTRTYTQRQMESILLSSTYDFIR